MNNRFSRVSGYGARIGLSALALLLTGCFKYKEPNVEAPHAIMKGTFLGGEKADNGNYAFGHAPMWSGCKGNKPKNECQVTKELPLDGRIMTVRLPVGEEMTLNIYSVVDSRTENWGYGNQTTTTYCYGDPLVVTPQAGDVIEFAYMYDAQVQGCQTAWKTGAASE